MAEDPKNPQDPAEDQPDKQPERTPEEEEEAMKQETSPPINLEQVDEEELEDADSPIHAEVEEAGEQKEAKDKAHAGLAKNKDPEPRVARVWTDEEYLKERLENQMNWYDRKSSINQKSYKKIKRREFFISASVPVLITLSQMAIFKSLQLPGSEEVGFPVVGADTVLSVLATVGGVYLAILKNNLDLEEYFKFWKEYRAMAEALQQERMLYLTRCEPYDEEDAYPMLVERVEAILNKERQKWSSRREHASKQQAPQQGAQLSNVPPGAQPPGVVGQPPRPKIASS